MRDFKTIMIVLVLFALVAALGWATAPALSSVASVVLTTDARSGDTGRDPHTHRYISRIPYGTATDQADVAWHDNRELASGAADTLDLRAGLTTTFGSTPVFATIKAVLVENTGDTTITIGSGSRPITSIMSGEVTIPAGGAISIMAPAVGYSTSSGTADILRIANDNTGTGSYKITIAGTSS